jgi:hypothetical protein
MMRSVLVFMAIIFLVLPFRVAPQTPPSAISQHESNFESERKQADELFHAQKLLEAFLSMKTFAAKTRLSPSLPSATVQACWPRKPPSPIPPSG